MSGEVYLIGAGCGDYDLITLRGLSVLKECDCVVYDSLIDERLLEFVPDNAERICAGKRAGKHSSSQEEINNILIQKALEGKKVARLKGGDPFVFGRGGEEILVLKAQNIPFSVIPAVSSAVAVPELAGIPVTHRNISRSFHVITGHTADNKQDFSGYAGLGGTLVFLMGLNNLRTIAEDLIRGGIVGNTPSAVISEGGTQKQRILKASLDCIADKAELEKIKAPAVIVVGDVVDFDFLPTVKKPLSGVSVSVTGTEKFTEKLSVKLEKLGAGVKRFGYLKILEYHENPELERAVENIEDYNYLVFTSINGAEIFIKHMRDKRCDIRKTAHLKIAVIGSGTASYLEKYGLFADIIPEKYTSVSLGNVLVNKIQSGERVLIARAEKGSPELTEILDKYGIGYDDIKIYDVVSKAGTMKCHIDDDYLIFASQSGVRAFFEGGFTVSENTKTVCIGKSTEKEAEKYIAGKIIIANPHTADGIVNAIMEVENEKIQKTAD